MKNNLNVNLEMLMKAYLLVVVCSVLFGCGGGGGTSENSQTTTNPNSNLPLNNQQNTQQNPVIVNFSVDKE